MIEAINATNGNSGVDYTPVFTHASAPAQDSAALSIDAQAKLLEEKGLTVGEIANALGLSLSAVQSDLGIVIASSQAQVATA
jgi:DNA-directed RNA polymerase specialized sigma24 family protein